jgi:hypothetical protein
MRTDESHTPRIDLPKEVNLGRVVVPSVYVRLMGIALTLVVIAGVGHLLGW